MFDRLRAAGQLSWALVGVFLLLSILAVLAWQVRVLFPPLVLAGAIVFLLNPIVSWLQNRRVPRAMGATATYLVIAAFVFLIGAMVWPLARDQGDELADQWPDVRDRIERWVDDRAADSVDWPIKVPTVAEIEDSLDADNRNFGETVGRIRDVGIQIFHIVLIFVLAPIIAFYVLVDLPNLRRATEALLPAGARVELMVLGRRLNRAVGGFFRGQLAVAIIVGLMVSVGLAIIDLPFWLIIGMVAGMFNMIPLIGPWVGAIPGVVIALTTADVSTAMWVAAVMAGAQQIDNHFISPLVMQRAVALHPAVVIMALLAGGTLGGFFGLLLAVPVTAMLKIVVGHVWRIYVLGVPLEQLAVEWEVTDLVEPAAAVAGVGTNPAGTNEAGTNEADTNEGG